LGEYAENRSDAMDIWLSVGENLGETDEIEIDKRDCVIKWSTALLTVCKLK